MRLVLGITGLLAVVFIAQQAAFFSQPWSRWWMSSTGSTQSVTVSGDFSDAVPPIALEPDAPAAPVTGNRVSDVERFQLIRAAGAPPDVAIVMTALSIAEDGAGDPAIISPPNWNKTVDVGILQVNSAHIGQCGITGIAWLQNAMNNVRAAMCILGPSLNYCAWSTFEERCGTGHTGAYRAFLAGATLIARGVAWQH